MSQLSVELSEIFISALNDGVFSGASVVVSGKKKGVPFLDDFHYGKTSLGSHAKVINNRTFFDLASLTKPLVTVISICILDSKNMIDLSDPLTKFFFNVPREKKQITVAQLLSHSSGLPAHREFFKELRDVFKTERGKWIVEAIMSEPLVAISGEKNIYSDLGYMLLGFIVEKCSGRRLDQFWLEQFCYPLGLNDEFIFPEAGSNNIFVETGTCSWSKEHLVGVVHDDNCRALGGIAGHAGLFGTAIGVCKVCDLIMSCCKDQLKLNCLDNNKLRFYTKRIGCSNWSMGFDMVSKIGSSSGKHFSASSIGHLGFTGTSFWIDLEEEVVIVLLSNRVLMGWENRKIKNFRPYVYDFIRNRMSDTTF